MVSNNVEPKKPVLGHIADILEHPLAATEKIAVHIQGIIWKLRGFKEIVFIDLSDPSGIIQVVCRKDKFSPDQWHNIKKLRRGHQVDVEGWTGKTNRGIFSVWANSITPRVLKIGKAHDNWAYFPKFGAHLIHRLFMLARVKRILRERLRDLNYDEIVIPVIKDESIDEFSSSQQLQLYGSGPPFAIIESPARLLFQSMLCGIHEVFAFGQIISEKLVGLEESRKYEATVLCVRRAYPQSHDMTKLAEDLVKSVLTHRFTKVTKAWTDPERLSSETIPDSLAVQRPTLAQASSLESQRISFHTQRTSVVTNPFRLIWPDRLLIAEGGIEKVIDSIPIGYLTLFLGNLVSVILQPAEFRSIDDQRQVKPSLG